MAARTVDDTTHEGLLHAWSGSSPGLTPDCSADTL
jgi:hypothetical protein